jgi:hypothetical protein
MVAGKMAKSQRKLTWRTPNDDGLKNDFAALGRDAKDYLEGIITDDVFAVDPYSTAYNLGRQALAREILGYTLPPTPEPKIVRNIDE